MYDYRSVTGMVSDHKMRKQDRWFFGVTALLMLSNREIIEVHTIDVSAGGLKIVASRNLPLSSKACIKFVMSSLKMGNKAIISDVEVTTSIFRKKDNGFVIGLKFLNIDEDAKLFIESFLEEKKRDY